MFFSLAFPNISPIAFSIGPLKVHWYGLAYLVGILLAWWQARLFIQKKIFSFSYKQIDDFITWSIIGIILGGRLGYVLFYNFHHFLKAPHEIFMTWQGGMSFHGGLLGMVIVTLIYSKKENLNIWSFGDLMSVVCPWGLFLGRIANFINGEHYGRPTNVEWGVVFPHSDGLARHPSQLYEAIGEGVILGVILFICVKKLSVIPGRLFGLFLTGYGLIRFVIEYFRDPDGVFTFPFIDQITQGQLLSIPMILFGLYLLIKKKTYEPA